MSRLFTGSSVVTTESDGVASDPSSGRPILPAPDKPNSDQREARSERVTSKPAVEAEHFPSIAQIGVWVLKGGSPEEVGHAYAHSSPATNFKARYLEVATARLKRVIAAESPEAIGNEDVTFVRDLFTHYASTMYVDRDLDRNPQYLGAQVNAYCQLFRACDTVWVPQGERGSFETALVNVQFAYDRLLMGGQIAHSRELADVVNKVWGISLVQSFLDREHPILDPEVRALIAPSVAECSRGESYNSFLFPRVERLLALASGRSLWVVDRELGEIFSVREEAKRCDFVLAALGIGQAHLLAGEHSGAAEEYSKTIASAHLSRELAARERRTRELGVAQQSVPS